MIASSLTLFCAVAAQAAHASGGAIAGRIGQAGATVTYSNSRCVLISAESAGKAGQADLYVSTDQRATWQRVDSSTDESGSLRYRAATDGRHELFLVVNSPVGASSALPAPGATAHAAVEIDTVAPMLQLRDARIETDEVGRERVVGRLALIEERLPANSLRVFYRAASDAAWMDGGAPRVSGGLFLWRVPAEIVGALDLSVVATDLAGNRARCAVLGLTRSGASTSQVALVRSGDSEVEPARSGGKHGQAEYRLSVPPVVPPVLGGMHGHAEYRETMPPAVPSVVPPVALPEAQRRARDLARRYLSEGRYALALARLEEALAALPNDLELLTMSAQALYWSGDYERAAAGYQTLLDAEPSGPEALDGLALIAATEQRHEDARDYLLQLLKDAPDSAPQWIALGDLEHRLGRINAAVAAWKRVGHASGSSEALRLRAGKRLRQLDPKQSSQGVRAGASSGNAAAEDVPG